jgi:hypothetical protein
MATIDGTYYIDTSASSDATWDIKYDGDKEKHYNVPPNKPAEPRTELVKNFHNIINELQLNSQNLAIVAFTKYKSNLEKDLSNSYNKSMPHYIYLVHPIITEPQHDPVDLFAYNLAVISDVLEYMPSVMAKANMIKEALTSLKQKKQSYLIITAKSEEEVKKSKNIDAILNEDDLISLALYAGASNIRKLDCMRKAKFPFIVATNGG